MKYLVTYLLAAWLAATVLARPPPPHRDAELLPGASWEADILELDPSGHVDKQSVAPPGTFGDIDATKWANYANLSAVPHVSNLAVDIGPQMANDIAPLPKEGTKLNLTVRMGGDNAYVGTLRKDRLEEAIYQCLIWSCPLNDLKRGMNACNTKNAWNPCKIDHIIYEGDDKSYRSDSGLYVWTDYVFTNPNLPGFGEAMYRAAGKALRLWTDDPESCHDVDFPTSRRTKVCSCPADVSVAFPTAGETSDNIYGMDGFQGLVAIRLEYGKYQHEYPHRWWTQGFSKKLSETLNQDLIPRIAKSIGRSASDIVQWSSMAHDCPPWFWYDHCFNG